MPNRKPEQPVLTPPPGDKQVAAKLAQGLTLVPYYARNERGVRTACCTWINLRRGESIADAAKRLTYANSSSEPDGPLPRLSLTDYLV